MGRRVTGLGDQRIEIAMIRTPDGHSRLELSRFLTPRVVADHRNAPVNALGYLRVMFTVEDLDTLARLLKRGAQLVGEVVQYKDALSALLHPGPEGLLIGRRNRAGCEARNGWKVVDARLKTGDVGAAAPSRSWRRWAM